MTCVIDPGIALARFIHYYFTTRQGLRDLGKASPGGAGRNRTLSVHGLASITVPLPSLAEQRRFCELLGRCDRHDDLAAEAARATHELQALLVNQMFQP